VDLDAVADELYSLPPQDFTGTRNERVKQARSSGDRDLATAIGALRRPSTSAWVVNLLVRERSDLVDQLLELAEALRAAQETLSGPELRALSTQRHRVIASIVGEARKLAVAHGGKVGDAGERELEATFDAALADPSAAEQVRAGRLHSALSYAGLGAAPTTSAPAPARVATASAPAPARPKADRDAEAERKRAEARRAAEQAVRDAEADAERATTERDEVLAEHRRAESQRDEVQQRVADLTEQLEQAQSDAVAAANAVREQQRKRSRADHRAHEAQRRLDRARDALEKVS
jgi:hypothetical protein